MEQLGHLGLGDDGVHGHHDVLAGHVAVELGRGRSAPRVVRVVAPLRALAWPAQAALEAEVRLVRVRVRVRVRVGVGVRVWVRVRVRSRGAPLPRGSPGW